MFSCLVCLLVYVLFVFFFFQAEDGIRDLVRSRGLGDVYKRQELLQLVAVVCVGRRRPFAGAATQAVGRHHAPTDGAGHAARRVRACLLYTSDAADERSSVDLGGRRIIKKKNKK